MIARSRLIFHIAQFHKIVQTFQITSLPVFSSTPTTIPAFPTFSNPIFRAMSSHTGSIDGLGQKSHLTDQNEGNGKSYLFWLSSAHENFMKAELEALLKIFNLGVRILDEGIWYGPFVILNFQREEDVRKILSRSVLIHFCIEIWAAGRSMEELHANFKNNLDVVIPYHNGSFRLKVETSGKKMLQAKKLELIETFDYIPIDGPVDLTNPECSLYVIQYYGQDCMEVPPEDPQVVFFGRWIGDAQRHIVSQISLKTRKFIGNTSMDPLLSLLMANLALVRPNSVVYDPFVGTGSLLVASALMGGYVMGTDIDYLMLHAKSKPTKVKVKKRAADESIFANLRQYGVDSRYLDVLIADSSLPLLRTELKFDTIITDPPYGVREAIERIGSEKDDCTVPEQHLENHFPQKVTYSLCDIFSDLIDFSAQRLNIGGRLVCWIPVARPYYKDEHLPANECFELVANCEQPLSAFNARRLLVYEKIAEPGALTKTFVNTTAEMYNFKSMENFIDKDKGPRRNKKQR